jgi:NADH dehydrogenase
VTGIDLDARTVDVVHGLAEHQHTLAWDYLVIALGSITNVFDLPGLEERAATMKSLDDAMHLRNLMIALLEEADTECCSTVLRPLLTFVVAGGGFAGVETIAGVNDFIRDSFPYYPNLDESLVRVVLVHAGETILPELGPELGAYAQRKLAERGVEIRTSARVAAVSDYGVTLSDGTTIPSRTVMWTAGTSPHPLVASLPCAREHGRIAVDEFLEVRGRPGVFALGDCALVPDSRTGGAHPPTAQHALREGKVVAANVLAAVTGGRKRAFDFSALGQLAAIGRRAGVARILGFQFSGFLAWWLWRTIHLSKLPRFEKKLRVALDWTLDVLFSKDLVQFLTERGHAGSRVNQTLQDRAVGSAVAGAPAATHRGVLPSGGWSPLARRARARRQPTGLLLRLIPETSVARAASNGVRCSTASSATGPST